VIPSIPTINHILLSPLQIGQAYRSMEHLSAFHANPYKIYQFTLQKGDNKRRGQKFISIYKELKRLLPRPKIFFNIYLSRKLIYILCVLFVTLLLHVSTKSLTDFHPFLRLFHVIFLLLESIAFYGNA